MNRRGFVLAAVLFALVVLAALAAGGLYAALQELRAGRNGQGQVRARSAAQAAVAVVVSLWDPRVLNSLASSAVMPMTVPAAPGESVTADVRRLNARLFLVRAFARDRSGAEQAVAGLVRLHSVETAPAAARARAVSPGLATRFDGVDRGPPGWVCPAVADTVPGLLLQVGQPDSAFFRFGDRNWADLATWAAAVPPGGDSLPVRFAPGDLVLTGGIVLGTLVVAGDLTLRGGVRVLGLALVRGSLRLEGAGGQIMGAAVASQIIADTSFSMVGPVVEYSSCSASMAAGSRAMPQPIPGASLVPLY